MAVHHTQQNTVGKDTGNWDLKKIASSCTQVPDTWSDVLSTKPPCTSRGKARMRGGRCRRAWVREKSAEHGLWPPQREALRGGSTRRAAHRTGREGAVRQRSPSHQRLGLVWLGFQFYPRALTMEFVLAEKLPSRLLSGQSNDWTLITLALMLGFPPLQHFHAPSHTWASQLCEFLKYMEVLLFPFYIQEN